MMTGIKSKWLKDKLLKYKKAATSILFLVSTLPGILLVLGDVNKYIWLGLTILFSIVSGLLFWELLSKTQKARIWAKGARTYLDTFHKTHHTWHMFKRRSDELYRGFNLDKMRLKIQKDIGIMLINLRSSLEEFHPGATLRICIKAIDYKNLKMFNEAAKGKYDYRKIPFILKDLDFRDPKETHATEIIDGLDFDEKTNGGGFADLKRTLFYIAFDKKNIQCCDKFDDVQQQYTSKYQSGLVSPIIVYDIPLGLICIGCKEKEVFCSEHEQVIATFTDCIAEYIRIDGMFTSIVESRKVIITGDSELERIEKKKEGEIE